MLFHKSVGGWLTTVLYLLVEQWYNYNNGEVVKLVRSDTLGTTVGKEGHVKLGGDGSIYPP